MTFGGGILIGLAQVLALVPGVSRSGATVSMGLALGYTRAAAARFAFLLAIPAVFLSGLYEAATSLGDTGAPFGLARHARRDGRRLRRRLRRDRRVHELHLQAQLPALRRLPHRTRYRSHRAACRSAGDPAREGLAGPVRPRGPRLRSRAPSSTTPRRGKPVDPHRRRRPRRPLRVRHHARTTPRTSATRRPTWRSTRSAGSGATPGSRSSTRRTPPTSTTRCSSGRPATASTGASSPRRRSTCSAATWRRCASCRPDDYVAVTDEVERDRRGGRRSCRRPASPTPCRRPTPDGRRPLLRRATGRDRRPGRSATRAASTATTMLALFGGARRRPRPRRQARPARPAALACGARGRAELGRARSARDAPAGTSSAA